MSDIPFHVCSLSQICAFLSSNQEGTKILINVSVTEAFISVILSLPHPSITFEVIQLHNQSIEYEYISTIGWFQ